ncbi:hypothetical protein Cgig2_006262 [Carnegiea gigantea]|uniref:Uncharacterized protein n=1 Tax=Carnegiea gigantea TaxID=171969 RepID=A0A9Q1Q4C2_9CARY|nr:hypothetical protein Cgig2_006262 [Carnegiea gigantea]
MVTAGSMRPLPTFHYGPTRGYEPFSRWDHSGLHPWHCSDTDQLTTTPRAPRAHNTNIRSIQYEVDDGSAGKRLRDHQIAQKPWPFALSLQHIRDVHILRRGKLFLLGGKSYPHRLEVPGKGLQKLLVEALEKAEERTKVQPYNNWSAKGAKSTYSSMTNWGFGEAKGAKSMTGQASPPARTSLEHQTLGS